MLGKGVHVDMIGTPNSFADKHDISFRDSYLTSSCHVACRVLRFVPRWNWLRGGMTWVFQYKPRIEHRNTLKLLCNPIGGLKLLCNPNQTFSVLLIYHHQRWSGLASTASGGISLGWEADFVAGFCWTNLWTRVIKTGWETRFLEVLEAEVWREMEGNGGKMWEGALLRPNLGNDTGAIQPGTSLAPSPSAPPVLLFGAPHLGTGTFESSAGWEVFEPAVCHLSCTKIGCWNCFHSHLLHPLPSPSISSISSPILIVLAQVFLPHFPLIFHHIFATPISASQHAGCHRRWQRWARRCPGHFANWKPWPIYRWYKWWSTYHVHGDIYIYMWWSSLMISLWSLWWLWGLIMMIVYCFVLHWWFSKVNKYQIITFCLIDDDLFVADSFWQLSFEHFSFVDDRGIHMLICMESLSIHDDQSSKIQWLGTQ